MVIGENIIPTLKLSLENLENKGRRGRSFSLGGDEKEPSPKQAKKRHNSPTALLRSGNEFSKDIKIGLLDSPKNKRQTKQIKEIKNLMDPSETTQNKEKDKVMIEEEKKEEEVKLKEKEDGGQSTDEEDKNRRKEMPNVIVLPFDSDTFDQENANDGTDDFVKIRQRLENEGTGVRHSPIGEKEIEVVREIQTEEVKEEITLSPEEKLIKEVLKEETLEMLWRLCQEAAVVQGVELSVHKGATDAFALSLSYNNNEVRWKYLVKLTEKLQQNESVLAMCSILRKFLQSYPEGDIEKIRSSPPQEDMNEDMALPKTRIELIAKMDRELSLMNELMSLSIEFKRNILDHIYDRLGRNPEREQSLETQSSLSANEAEGEDTGEDEEVQTDAASQTSPQLSENGNEENEGGDIVMKTNTKPQALSEGDGFMVPKNRRISNNDEEEKEQKQGANQSLSITDISMTDEEAKEKDFDRRLISKRSYSASHRDPRHRHVIHESPTHNQRENEFLANLQTNAVYQMKYFKEVEERLEFIKFILRNSDEVMKPMHFKILWECFIGSSFHEKERAIFLEWITSIIKIQSSYANTRKEGLVVIDDDTIEVIFFECLLCLDFSTIPMEAYN